MLIMLISVHSKCVAEMRMNVGFDGRNMTYDSIKNLVTCIR